MMEVLIVRQGDPDLHLPAVLAAHQRLPLLLGLRLRGTGLHQVGLQRKRQRVRATRVLRTRGRPPSRPLNNHIDDSNHLIECLYWCHNSNDTVYGKKTLSSSNQQQSWPQQESGMCCSLSQCFSLRGHRRELHWCPTDTRNSHHRVSNLSTLTDAATSSC